MNTTDTAIAAAGLALGQASATRPTIPSTTHKHPDTPTEGSPLPLGETEAFHATWQALMQQLDRLLSLAHTHVPCLTEFKESASVARFYLTQLERLAENR